MPGVKVIDENRLWSMSCFAEGGWLCGLRMAACLCYYSCIKFL
jgi:hypothetical protein